MATRKTVTEPVEETVTETAPVKKDDCGCRKNDKGQVELQHAKLETHIFVNPESVNTWEQQGWETILA